MILAAKKPAKVGKALRFICPEDCEDDANHPGFWIPLDTWNRYRNDTYKERHRSCLRAQTVNRRSAEKRTAPGPSCCAALPVCIGQYNKWYGVLLCLLLFCKILVSALWVPPLQDSLAASTILLVIAYYCSSSRRGPLSVVVGAARSLLLYMLYWQ